MKPVYSVAGAIGSSIVPSVLTWWFVMGDQAFATTTNRLLCATSIVVGTIVHLGANALLERRRGVR